MVTCLSFPDRQPQVSDFDLRVEPLLQALLHVTVEQASLEIVVEEELAFRWAQQCTYLRQYNAEMAERLEEQQRRRREEEVGVPESSTSLCACSREARKPFAAGRAKLCKKSALPHRVLSGWRRLQAVERCLAARCPPLCCSSMMPLCCFGAGMLQGHRLKRRNLTALSLCSQCLPLVFPPAPRGLWSSTGGAQACFPTLVPRKGFGKSRGHKDWVLPLLLPLVLSWQHGGQAVIVPQTPEKRRTN